MTYPHFVDGRIRIRLPQLRGAAVAAADLEDMLAGLPGVVDVTANSLTGNVFVSFEPTRTSHQVLLNALRRGGYLDATDDQWPDELPRPFRFAEVIAESVIEMGEAWAA